MKNKEDRILITEHTKIELGLIVSLIAISGSGLVFIARSLAEIEDHGKRITRVESREEKIEALANDMNYLKGRFDAQFPPKKNLNNGQ